MTINLRQDAPDQVDVFDPTELSEAIEQLKSADIIIIPRKGNSKSDLADLRYQICNKILGEECPQLFEFDLPTRNNKNR